jgi:hypothetical protein
MGYYIPLPLDFAPSLVHIIIIYNKFLHQNVKTNVDMPPTLHPPAPMLLLHSSVASAMPSSSLQICIVVGYLVHNAPALAFTTLVTSQVLAYQHVPISIIKRNIVIAIFMQQLFPPHEFSSHNVSMYIHNTK